jgi:hypothetical protein
MTCSFTARGHIQATEGLAAVLDAAYAAFEEMLVVIHAHQNPDDLMFVPFVMAAACAASGRDAILFAPALPPCPLQAAGAAAGECQAGDALAAARELAALCQLLEVKIDRGGQQRIRQRDRSACLDAAAQARELRGYLTGSAP